MHAITARVKVTACSPSGKPSCGTGCRPKSIPSWYKPDSVNTPLGDGARASVCRAPPGNARRHARHHRPRQGFIRSIAHLSRCLVLNTVHLSPTPPVYRAISSSRPSIYPQDCPSITRCGSARRSCPSTRCLNILETVRVKLHCLSIHQAMRKRAQKLPIYQAVSSWKLLIYPRNCPSKTCPSIRSLVDEDWFVPDVARNRPPPGTNPSA